MKYINTTTSTIIMVYTDGNSGGAYLFRVIDREIFEMWDVAVGGWVGMATSHKDISIT